jgi:hypothetical protein
VLVQDVGRGDAKGSAFRQYHNHELTRSHILDVMRQVLELFELQRTDQLPLKLREKSVRGPGRVQTLKVLLAVQDVDVLLAESGLEQRVDGRPRLVGVADGPDHAICRVRDEVPLVGSHCFHGHDLVRQSVNVGRAGNPAGCWKTGSLVQRTRAWSGVMRRLSWRT